MRVRAGSGAVSGRDVFACTADAEIWLVDRDDPLLDRADPYARRVFRDAHPLDNDPAPLFDDGNGNRIMLGPLGVKAAARRQHRAAAAGAHLRHADRRRGRRALLLVRQVRHPGRVGRVRRGRRPVRRTARRAPADRDREFAVVDVQRGEPVRLPRRPVRRLRLPRQHRLPGRQPAVRLRAGSARRSTTTQLGRRWPTRSRTDLHSPDVHPRAGGRGPGHLHGHPAARWSAARPTTPTASRTRCRSWR